MNFGEHVGITCKYYSGELHWVVQHLDYIPVKRNRACLDFKVYVNYTSFLLTMMKRQKCSDLIIINCQEQLRDSYIKPNEGKGED